jgi:hypothetical protein
VGNRHATRRSCKFWEQKRADRARVAVERLLPIDIASVSAVVISVPAQDDIEVFGFLHQLGPSLLAFPE